MKKENTQGMKILCYFGIIICLVLIVVPPVLRKVMPKPKEDNTPKEKYTLLACNTSDNGEVVVYSYYTEELQIGQVKYTFVEDAENFIANNLKQDLERLDILAVLVQNPGEPDRRQLLLKPADSSSNVLSSDELKGLREELKRAPISQKEYYEGLDFTCKITEN